MNNRFARMAVWGLGALLFTACTTTTRTRFAIDQPEAQASADDREAVKEMLAAIAAPLRLKDFTVSSIVPETIAFYQQADTTNPLKIIAWVEDGRIMVDLLQFPGEPGETRLYQRARDLLQKEMRSRFGDRSAIVAFREVERAPQPESR
jgi:hypothetical protein